MEGKENGRSNLLSRHPLVQLPKEKPSPPNISFESKTLDVASEAHLYLVKNVLSTKNLPVDLGADDWVALKRSS